MKICLKALLTLALISGCTPDHGVMAKAYVPVEDNIRLLLCGGYLGTGYIIEKNILVTANHVVSDRPCRDAITGATVKVIDRDVDHDYALISFDTGDTKPLKYSCARYKKGRTYTSVGYGGGKFQSHSLRAMGDYTTKGFTVGPTPVPGMRAFVGDLIPGMSGGPIVDDKGVAHGINNVTSPGFGFSFELADTPLCTLKNPIAQPLPPLSLDTSSL